MPRDLKTGCAARPCGRAWKLWSLHQVSASSTSDASDPRPHPPRHARQAAPQASHGSGTQGLAVGLDNGTIVVLLREVDEARTLTKLRTLTVGANMGRVRAPAQEPGIVALGPRGVSQVAVAPSEEGLAVCTRDRQLLLVNTVGLLEGTQVRGSHGLPALPVGGQMLHVWGPCPCKGCMLALGLPWRAEACEVDRDSCSLPASKLDGCSSGAAALDQGGVVADRGRGSDHHHRPSVPRHRGGGPVQLYTQAAGPHCVYRQDPTSVELQGLVTPSRLQVVRQSLTPLLQLPD